MSGAALSRLALVLPPARCGFGFGRGCGCGVEGCPLWLCRGDADGLPFMAWFMSCANSCSQELLPLVPPPPSLLALDARSPPLPKSIVRAAARCGPCARVLAGTAACCACGAWGRRFNTGGAALPNALAVVVVVVAAVPRRDVTGEGARLTSPYASSSSSSSSTSSSSSNAMRLCFFHSRTEAEFPATASPSFSSSSSACRAALRCSDRAGDVWSCRSA